MSYWDETREAKLKELWEKGHTASQIAEALGGTTRNAVIGKAHRLKLAGRVQSTKTQKQNKPKVFKVKRREIISKEEVQILLLDKNFVARKSKKLEELDDKNFEPGK